MNSTLTTNGTPHAKLAYSMNEPVRTPAEDTTRTGQQLEQKSSSPNKTEMIVDKKRPASEMKKKLCLRCKLKLETEDT